MSRRYGGRPSNRYRSCLGAAQRLWQTDRRALIPAATAHSSAIVFQSARVDRFRVPIGGTQAQGRQGSKVEFRILGPLEVLHNGSPVALNGPRQERIVAALLTAPDRTVGFTALVDTLWENPPPTARTQVHNGVSTL